jgi:hypothetical protein
MRGLDPRIHLLAKGMDCRVKPGNDNRFNMTGNRCSRLTLPTAFRNVMILIISATMMLTSRM